MHNPKLPNIQMVLLPTVYGSQLCRTWDHVVEIAIDWTWIPHSQTYRLLWQLACHCCVQESWTLHNKAHWFVWVRLTFTCFCLRLNYLLISAFLPQHLIGAMGMGINRFNVDFRYASQCRCGWWQCIYMLQSALVCCALAACVHFGHPAYEYRCLGVSCMYLDVWVPCGEHVLGRGDCKWVPGADN